MRKKGEIAVIVTIALIVLSVASLFLISNDKFDFNFTGFDVYDLPMTQNADYLDGYISLSGVSYTPNSIEYLRFGNDGATYRSYIDFDISSIPSGATINSIKLKLTYNDKLYGAAGTADNFNVYSLTQKAATRLSNNERSILYDECGGSVYSSYNTFSPAPANTPAEYDLTSQAVTDLQNKVNSHVNYFSIGLKAVNEDTEGYGDIFYNSETSTAEYRPVLIVNYSGGAEICSDTTAPTISISNPATNSNLTSNSGSVSYSASDNTALGSCWWSIDGGQTNSSLGGCTGSSASGSITGQTWPQGTTNVIVYVNDSCGNQNYSQVTFNVDSISPTVNIIYPSNIAYNHSITQLNYTTTEAGSCVFNNGTANLTISASGINFTSLTSQEGLNSWNVYCNDSFGNIGASTISFSQDTSVPLISIITPLDNSNLTTNLVGINFTRSDINLQSCWFYNGTGNTTISCSSNITQIFSQGNNNVIIYVNDSLGNRNQTSVSFFVDSVNPELNITSPANNSVQAVTNPTINYTSFDLNLQSCWFYNGTANTTLICGQNITQTWNSGQNNLTVYVNDSLGNKNQSSLSFYIDTTHPAITLSSPSSGLSTTTTSQTFQYSVSDSGPIENCSLVLNGIKVNNSNSITRDTTMSFSRTLSVGNYTWNINCTDSVNGEGTSSIRSINITSSSGGGGGGGGDTCIVSSWTCSSWSSCSASSQTRTCTSNCVTQKTETQVCNVTNVTIILNITNCTNECIGFTTRCTLNNTILETCTLVDSCYKLDQQLCTLGCENSACKGNLSTNVTDNDTVPPELEKPKTDDYSPVQSGARFIAKAGNSLVEKVTEFENLSTAEKAVVVTTGTTGVATVATGIWFGWIWIAFALLVPFFLRRLRHHLAALFDFNNSLELIKISHNKTEINKKKLDEFVSLLEKKYGKMTFAGLKDNSARFLVERGFIEIQLTHPVIINGHFSNTKDEKKFQKILQDLIHESLTVKESKNIKILESTEKASMFSMVRSMNRAKKTEKQINKLKLNK